MDCVQNKLYFEYERLKSQNGQYSKRAFAKKLGISSGALSSILNGDRKVSKKLALRFVSNLDIHQDNITSWLSSFSNTNQPNEQKQNIQYIKIQTDQYQAMSEWYHLAILSLLNTDDFRSNSLWISSKLDISQTVCEKAIKRLLDLGLLFIENGTYKRKKSPYETSDNIKSLSLQKSHKETLHMAAKSIDRDDITKRDITALTMAIDPLKIPKAKEMIRNFQDELASFLEGGNKTQVYKLGMQLFPLTK